MEDLLSPVEREEFSSLIHVVRVGVENFYEAGRALTIIRDKRLYREKYDTFESFCLMEFKMSKSYAHRIIIGCHTIDQIENAVAPSSERVARELNKAPPPTQKRIWKRALEISPKPSVSVVHEATMEIAPEVNHQDTELLHRLRAASKLLSVTSDAISVRPVIFPEIISLLASMVICLKKLLGKLISQRTTLGLAVTLSNLN